jgi:hypothetical protein
MKNVGARFRNRKINNKQSLRVYRAVDIPDLDESISLQRSIPQTETGVDKEEESVSCRLCTVSFFFPAILDSQGKKKAQLTQYTF